MKIGLDLSSAEHDPAGIGQYSLSLFTELCRIDNGNEYYSYTTAPFLLGNAENRPIRINEKFPAKGLRWIYKVSRDASENNLDLLISPSNHIFTQFFPRTLQFIHDLAPIYYPKFFGRIPSLKYKATCKIACKKSKGLVTISKTVQEEISSYFNIDAQKIDYIYPGLNQWMQLPPKAKSIVMEEYGLDNDYILTLSTLEPRKNHVNMLEGFKKFKKKTLSPLKFLIIGKKGWYYEEIFAKVKELELEDEVIFLGYIPNKQLSSIISHAKLFIYMSHYEGFGIPPLEAMNLGIPTIVSDIPVFREAYKKYANYTDPLSTDKIALALEETLQEKPSAALADYVRDNFSWGKSAKKLLNIINENKYTESSKFTR